MKRILVAIDDSVRGPHVLAAAIELARLTGATVRVYQAISVPPDFPPAAVTNGDPLPSHMRRAATERIGKLLEASPDVRCEIVIGESHSPPRAILDAGDAFAADLIVREPWL